ncbi:MAG: tripartite tricarboxylate transporter substrate binding protein, partial [Pseudomonadota bacterium]
MTMLRFRVMSFAVTCLIFQFAAASWAQSYPARAVRFVLPTPPGSGADIIGRIFADGLTEVFGRQVIVDNRGGASGNIGAEFVAKSPPDGYTLFQVATNHPINVSLFPNVPFDLVRDFAAVTRTDSSPIIVVVHPSLPVKSIADLVKLTKANPGAVSYSSAGAASTTFVAVELFTRQAGVKMLHVPYRGGGQALTAVVSGEVSVYFAPVTVAMPFIKEGRLRLLAISTAKRLTWLPEYPTVAESGFPGYEFGFWHGLMVPAQTPKETIAAIHAATIKTLGRSDIIKRMRDLG